MPLSRFTRWPSLWLAGAALLLATACATRPGSPGLSGPPGPAGTIHQLEITQRSPAFEGQAFGAHGAYERIVAIAHGRLDPHHPANAGIADLQLAPRNAQGQVEYQTDVIILRPQDAAKARRVLVYDVANRGRPLAHTLYFNEGAQAFDKPTDAGNGFFMRQGYTLVWSGWQGDMPLVRSGKAVGTRFPVAKQADGQPITGTVRDEFVFDKREARRTATLSYAVAHPDPAQATLRVRAQRSQPWQTLSGWRYDGAQKVVFDHPAGFDDGAIFEFIYPAKDPVVMGLAFAAVRDLISHLRYSERDGSGGPNPLADLRQSPCETARLPQGCPAKPVSTVDVAILEGISQSGRLVRDFIWQDFNRDGLGRQVFNGAMPLIAGSRKTWTNFRFAQPGRWSKQHEEHHQIGDQFPFTYGVHTDPVSGQRGGIFERCATTQTCPKLMHLDGGAEFWQARSSLIAADGLGQDLPLHPEVRAYLMAGTPHAYAVNGLSVKSPVCALPSNTVHPASTARALMVALVDWVGRGVPPPHSRWPSVAAGTLVEPNDARAFGDLDLARIGVPSRGVINDLAVTDYGRMPPVDDPARRYRLLVPTANADGNPSPGTGVLTPDLVVPTATHLSWNPRGPGFAPGQACGAQGATLPFGSSPGDSRAPLKARYPSQADFVARVSRAAEALVPQRLMLAEDVGAWTRRAQAVKGW